jgi:hypothetical protein
MHCQLACQVKKSRNTSARIPHELDAIMFRRGRPTIIVSDNGAMASRTIQRWSQDLIMVATAQLVI